MGNSRLSKRFMLYDWNNFAKGYKKNYKEENGKALTQNVAYTVTFGCLMKQSLFDSRTLFKEPEVEDVVLLIKLGNSCDDKEACQILENYLDDETIEYRSITLAMIELIIDFYSNLKLSKTMLDKAYSLKDAYIEDMINKDKDIVEDNNSDNTKDA